MPGTRHRSHRSTNNEGKLAGYKGQGDEELGASVSGDEDRDPGKPVGSSSSCKTRRLLEELDRCMEQALTENKKHRPAPRGGKNARDAPKKIKRVRPQLHGVAKTRDGKGNEVWAATMKRARGDSVFLGRYATKEKASAAHDVAAYTFSAGAPVNYDMTLYKHVLPLTAGMTCDDLASALVDFSANASGAGIGSAQPAQEKKEAPAPALRRPSSLGPRQTRYPRTKWSKIRSHLGLQERGATGNSQQLQAALLTGPDYSAEPGYEAVLPDAADKAVPEYDHGPSAVDAWVLQEHGERQTLTQETQELASWYDNQENELLPPYPPGPLPFFYLLPVQPVKVVWELPEPGAVMMMPYYVMH